MSNNERSRLPTGLAKQRRNDKQRRKPDLRIRRTRSLLSNALVALMQEKSIDKITVQEVLDRATMGRSTFYLHYRGRDDLFFCVLEEGPHKRRYVCLRIGLAVPSLPPRIVFPVALAVAKSSRLANTARGLAIARSCAIVGTE